TWKELVFRVKAPPPVTAPPARVTTTAPAPPPTLTAPSTRSVPPSWLRVSAGSLPAKRGTVRVAPAATVKALRLANVVAPLPGRKKVLPLTLTAPVLVRPPLRLHLLVGGALKVSVPLLLR